MKMLRIVGAGPRSVAFLAAVSVVLLLPAAAEAAKPDVVLGPIKVRHGFSLTITVSNCGPKPSLDLDYFKGNDTNSISHDYGGAVLTCKVSRSLGAGSLSADWPGVLSFKLKIGHAGTPIKIPPGKGCRGRAGAARYGRATGTLDISIHSAALGVVNRHKVVASIERFGALRCTTPKTPKEISVDAAFGQAYLIAEQPSKGRRTVFISESGDDPAAGVTGNLFVSLKAGKSLFNARKDLSSATIGSVKRFTTGSMTFSALPACPGSPDARNGSLSGALTVEDPVLGNLTLIGSSASFPFIARGDAFPGTCNGTGA